jgi:hypothetical protein
MKFLNRIMIFLVAIMFCFQGIQANAKDKFCALEVHVLSEDRAGFGKLDRGISGVLRQRRVGDLIDDAISAYLVRELSGTEEEVLANREGADGLSL